MKFTRQSSALSARPGIVKVFQFGGAAKNNPSNYFELSDRDSSSVPYDPEVETEFSRLRDDGILDNMMIVKKKGTTQKSVAQRGAYQEREDENLFLEDFVRMSKHRRSKSLDQIHTIVLSDNIFTRKTSNNRSPY